MKKNDNEQKKKRMSLITLIAICVLVVSVVVFLVLKKDDIRINSLLKRDNIITSELIYTGDQIDVYPRAIHSKYINITSDGIVYILEDNGYNEGDKHRKLMLLSEQKIDTSKLEVLKFELNNLMVVSPEDKINDDGTLNYVEVSFNSIKKMVYENEFNNLLQKYGINVKGE